MEVTANMARITLTYGVLPTEDQFEIGWDEAFSESGGNEFRFVNDKRVGNTWLNRFELWAELQKAVAEFHGGLLNDDAALADDPRTTEEIEKAGDSAGDWASAVLGQLGIEWC
jgi:hypothetical protein